MPASPPTPFSFIKKQTFVKHFSFIHFHLIVRNYVAIKKKFNVFY